MVLCGWFIAVKASCASHSCINDEFYLLKNQWLKSDYDLKINRLFTAGASKKKMLIHIPFYVRIVQYFMFCLNFFYIIFFCSSLPQFFAWPFSHPFDIIAIQRVKSDGGKIVNNALSHWLKAMDIISIQKHFYGKEWKNFIKFYSLDNKRRIESSFIRLSGNFVSGLLLNLQLKMSTDICCGFWITWHLEIIRFLY